MSVQSNQAQDADSPARREEILSCQSFLPQKEQSLRIRGGDVLACAFGMTVAAWIVAYVSRMPMVRAPGQVTVFLMLAMVFLGGVVAARYSAKGILAALLAGMLSGILDILVVGSVLHDAAQNAGSVAPAAALWIGGSILLNTVVAGFGGILGAIFPSARRGEIRWTAVFALVLTAATLPLLTAGGLVTAFRAGMAVPDWPQSYGYNMFLFPLSRMQSAQGNFYEHAHRLMGSLVGLTSLVLAIYVTLADRAGWRKVFAWAIFAAVCVQGVVGGTRVIDNSVPLAVLHGIFAQLVFASMASLAAVCSRSFARIAPQLRPDATTDRLLSAALVLAMVTQLTLGALVRHFDVMVLMHVVMAAGVALLVVTCGFRAFVLHGKLLPLRRTGLAVMCVVTLQLILGVAALALRPGKDGSPTTTSALWTTAHQANGAILLATCVVLAVWNWRLLVPSSSPVPADQPETLPPAAALAG